VRRRARTPGTVRRLLTFAAPDLPRLAAACALGVLAVLSVVLLMAASAWLISAASLQPPLLVLSLAIVGVRAFALGRAAFRYLERLVAHDVAFRLLARLRVRFYRHLEPLAPAGLAEFRRGDLLARMVGDVDAVQDLSLRVLQPAAVAAAAAAASVGLVALLLPSAAAVLLTALLMAAVAAPAATAWAGRRAETRLAGARAELTGDVVALLRAAPDLIAFDAAAAQLDRIDARDGELTRIARRDAAATGLGAGLAGLCSGMAVWGSLTVGAPAVRAGVLDGTALAVVVLVPLAAFEAVQLLPTALLALARTRSSGERVLAVLDQRPPVPEPAGPVALLAAGPGALRLRGVSARWPDAAADALPAIHGVDLDLEPGRRVAVVGASGAGKSTLAAVLLRFADLTAGSYRIDGREVRDLAGDDVRRVVGLCAQDAHVFDSTVRENLRLARPGCDDAALRAALRRARLLPWVDGLPHGLDTSVGERGVRMSAGQRQRLALARALLADFPMLVLDEPTANLDPPTAAELTDDLLTATTDRAVLLITHRLDGLDRVDEILVLEAGRVVERGTHTELLQTKGRFHDLWAGASGHVCAR
jgi:thiol reductant ABC exporter CydC subunit